MNRPAWIVLTPVLLLVAYSLFLVFIIAMVVPFALQALKHKVAAR